MAKQKRRAQLAGDVIGRALVEARAGSRDDLADRIELPPRERTGPLDPQSLAEFTAYDIPFETDPAVGFVFPKEVERG